MYALIERLSADQYIKTALQNPDPVNDYLQAGRVVGPLDPYQLEGAQVSPFGVIPKAGQPEKWRLIVDLSSRRKYGVNYGISKELCSLKYASVEDVVQRIWSTGRSTLLEIDIQHAYRNILVHMEDGLLLGY